MISSYRSQGFLCRLTSFPALPYCDLSHIVRTRGYKMDAAMGRTSPSECAIGRPVRQRPKVRASPSRSQTVVGIEVFPQEIPFNGTLDQNCVDQHEACCSRLFVDVVLPEPPVEFHVSAGNRTEKSSSQPCLAQPKPCRWGALLSASRHMAVGAANPEMLRRLLPCRISPGGPANQSSKDSRLPRSDSRG
jgi:hypothetical protein